MKKPDEIKKGLEFCGADECHGDQHTSCPYNGDMFCIMHTCADALALIKQLEAQNAELLEEIERLQAERDAAVNDLKELADRQGACFGCKWFTGERCGDTEYKIICGFHDSKWEWRGVQKEERNE